MGPFEKLKEVLKESWARINEGGVPISNEWRADTGFRRAVETYANTGANIEGGLFIDDLKEFYTAMDAFNVTRPENMRFNLVLHKDIAEGFEAEALGEKKTTFGFFAVGPLALERNARVYEGRYFSDMAEISGFAFTQSGTETRFLCGMDKKTDFEGFALRLLNPPPHYPHPTLPRYV